MISITWRDERNTTTKVSVVLGARYLFQSLLAIGLPVYRCTHSQSSRSTKKSRVLGGTSFYITNLLDKDKVQEEIRLAK